MKQITRPAALVLHLIQQACKNDMGGAGQIFPFCRSLACQVRGSVSAHAFEGGIDVISIDSRQVASSFWTKMTKFRKEGV